MNANAPFGRLLKQRRAELDLTQEALAELVGCAPQTIRKIESGERRPSQQMAERLAQVLEIPAAEQAAFLKDARSLTVSPSPHAPTPALERVAQTRPLPSYSTPFVGRSRELAELTALLAAPDSQLISVVGPGGMGKTRLAVEAATLTQAFVDGVVFVSLASVDSTALAVATIADALGFTFHGPLDAVIQLRDYLRDKELLLVLDNLEQLVAGTEQFIGPLLEAPSVKLLVTTRERLNIQGEWVVELPGMSVDGGRASDALELADGVALFVERARRVQHGFVLSPDDRPHVVRICEMVDGLPLGIELAAAWVRLLSCAEIVDEMSRSFDFLEASSRDMPGRHHSLRTVFEHSWHLLSEDERTVLQQLAVFRGGFSRAAAAQVAGATLPVLASLVDKSLLRRTKAGRYHLHESVRQYASSHLEVAGELREMTSQRHSSYYLTWLVSRSETLIGPDQQPAILEISDEIDNIRGAWDWALHHRRLADIRQALPTLHWFFDFRTWFQEGEAFFRQAASVLDKEQGAAAGTQEHRLILGQVLASQGYLASRFGQFSTARTALERSLTLLRSAEDEGALASALLYRGIVAYQVGDYEDSRGLIDDALAISRRRGIQWNIALGLLTLANVADATGEYREAERLFREDLRVWRAIDNPRGLSMCLNFFSATLYRLGEYAEAQALLHESLTLCTATDDRVGFTMALDHLGLVAQAQGDYQEASYLFSESVMLFREIGNQWDTTRALNHLGTAALALGDRRAARQHFLEALSVAMDVGAAPDALGAAVNLASLLADEGQIERAVELCALVEHHPSSGQDVRQQAAELRASITPPGTEEHPSTSGEPPTVRPLEAVLAELLGGRSAHALGGRRR